MKEEKMTTEMAVLITLGASLVVSFMVFGLARFASYSNYTESLPAVRENAINGFIADCAKDPKSCQYLNRILNQGSK